MELKEYFRSTKGLGVLSTADEKGKVDSAVYARPKVGDDGRVAFIMSDRLSISNVRKNPYAAYLFKENGEGWTGVRLFLNTRTRRGKPPMSPRRVDKNTPGLIAAKNIYRARRSSRSGWFPFFPLSATARKKSNMNSRASFARLKTVLKGQRLGILATRGTDYPYQNIVSYSVSGDLKQLIFATSRASEKYANIQRCPRVALFVDNRKNTEQDLITAVGITALGDAKELLGPEERRGKDL